MLQIQINCKQFSWGGPLDLPLPEPTLLTCLEPFCTYTSAQRLESDSALFVGGKGFVLSRELWLRVDSLSSAQWRQDGRAARVSECVRVRAALYPAVRDPRVLPLRSRLRRGTAQEERRRQPRDSPRSARTLLWRHLRFHICKFYNLSTLGLARYFIFAVINIVWFSLKQSLIFVYD